MQAANHRPGGCLWSARENTESLYATIETTSGNDFNERSKVSD